MNHAEKVKVLASNYAFEFATEFDPQRGKHEKARYHKSWTLFTAAIDEMQAEIDRLSKSLYRMDRLLSSKKAEIDRLKQDAERAHRYGRLLIGCRSAMRAAGQKANYSTDWQHMVSAIDAAMKERGEGA